MKFLPIVVIDGKKISNVDRMSVYQPNTEAVDESRSNEHDDYVLRRLMKKSGELTSRCQHLFISTYILLITCSIRVAPTVQLAKKMSWMETIQYNYKLQVVLQYKNKYKNYSYILLYNVTCL